MDLTLGRDGSLRHGRAFAVVSLVVAFAIGLAATAERADAQSGEPRVILFLVDTSTSMYGQPLADAKSALKGGSSVLAGTDVGLRSFGGGCENPGVERLAIGPFDGTSFNAAVDTLATGESGTPTPAALRAAGATLPSDGDRTIVLVSDGESSCSNPCPAARELKDRLGVGFRIDTVGFRTPYSSDSELACIARVTGGTYVTVSGKEGSPGSPAAPGSGAAALQEALAQAAAARVTALQLTPSSFVAAARGGTVGKGTRKKGTQVRHTVSENAETRFTVKKARVGRKVNGECRKRTAKNRRSRRCVRYVRLRGSIVMEAVKGDNRFWFTGRWNGKRLRPGRYKLTATPTDANGIVGKSKVARFKVVRR